MHKQFVPGSSPLPMHESLGTRLGVIKHVITESLVLYYTLSKVDFLITHVPEIRLVLRI